MPYTHNGRSKVVTRKDPFDPNSKDWFYFVLEDILRKDEGEVLLGAEALIVGGIIEQGPIYLATRKDANEVLREDVYAIEISYDPELGLDTMELTLRFSTSLGVGSRTNIDRTIIIPVREL